MHVADLIDVFADRAAPALRRERPALIAARLRWAAVRVAAGREGSSPIPPGGERLATDTVGGVSVGEAVQVELEPNLWGRGVVVAWIRDALPHAAVTVVLAKVRLDPWPDGVTPPPRFAAGATVNRRRSRLLPIDATIFPDLA